MADMEHANAFGLESVAITRIKDGTREQAEDVVAREVPLTLNVGGRELATLQCSPGDLDDFVRGFLFTSGIVKDAAQITAITLDQQRWSCDVDITGSDAADLAFKRLYTSGCGRGALFYNPLDIMYRTPLVSGLRMKAAAISTLMREFLQRSEGFAATGGVHGAALATEEALVVFREDIGRHNAIDKAVGAVLAHGGTFDDKVLVSSGRTSSEVIFKARRCGIAIVASKSAPTDQAVKLARDMGITVIGFARGTRMNIYSVDERIL